VETLATTVRPSVGPLEVAEVAAILAAASEPWPKRLGDLKKGTYLPVGVRFVQCDWAHWGPVQALLSEPRAPPSTSPSVLPTQRSSVRNNNFASLHWSGGRSW